MAHDGIDFELFMYLCSDWQIPQEIFLVMQAKVIKNGFWFRRNTVILFSKNVSTQGYRNSCNIIDHGQFIYNSIDQSFRQQQVDFRREHCWSTCYTQSPRNAVSRSAEFHQRYSIVKDSSADLGVNFKIVQNRPTVKAVCTKNSKIFFCIFVNIFVFLRENKEVSFFIF